MASPSDKPVLFDDKLNILVAYPYFSASMREEVATNLQRIPHRMIVDSGAFTAYNAGHIITLDEYCEFLTSIQKDKINIDAYIQLDVVFNEPETIKNYKIMLDRGFDPAPVFTRGADDDYFHELLEQDKYVFVGGVQSGIKHENFAKWVLERSAGKKVHMLAFIRPDFVNHYKPYSVDASSWSGTSRFGNMYYFWKGRIRQTSKAKFAKSPSREFIDACRALKIPDYAIKGLKFNDSWQSFGATGFDPKNEHVPEKGLAQFIALIHYVYYSVMAQNKIGTKIYLAIGMPSHLRVVMAAYQHLKDNKII